MSSVNAPFGLKPVYHPSGTIIPVTGSIASGYASNIFQYSPVAYNDGVIELAAAASPAIGSFAGVRWIDTRGRPQFSNYWPAATVGTEIVCWFTSDPATIYEIQCSGPVLESDIGEQADWSANTTNSGSTGTGLSNVTMDTPAVTTDGLQVIGISLAPDNTWGDAFTVVRVRINEHQNQTATPGY